MIERLSITLSPDRIDPENPDTERLSASQLIRRTPAGSGDGVSLLRARRSREQDFVYIWTVPQGESAGTLRAVRELASTIESSRIRGRLDAAQTPDDFRRILLGHLPFREVPEPAAATVVGRTGFLFGGVIQNVKGKLPHYGSDFADAMNLKGLAAIFFMYFACLAPAVAFGGLVAALTDGQLGVVEMMVSTAVCGIAYPLLAGQPMTILGSTGPVIIFIGLLFELCRRWGIAFLPSLAWVGLWTSLIMIVMAATEASRLIRWFTRFTDEIFAALISLIFIAEALGDTLGGVRDPNVPRESAFLGVILALGTFIVASQLAQLRRTPYLKSFYRNLLADFGPVIAIGSMVLFTSYLGDVQIERLALPERFGTTSGRPWLVDLWSVPMWVRLSAIVPAFLVSVLLFVDQNITVRLVNSSKHPLRKGFGYHLDMLLVGILVGICSIFGLPWMVAATVRSLNHVQSLATVQREDGEDVVVSVLENRFTALSIHILIAISLFFLDELRPIPMAVLFGLFLYMGVSSMRGNQLFERMRLWLMDPARYPSTFYLRTVPNRVVHAFTAVQVFLLALLWVLKTSAIGILFPLLIALLVPIRFLLNRFFDERYLSRLDGEEIPDEEKEHVLGP